MRAICLALALAGCSAPGTAQGVPTGPVVDAADILPADDEALLDRHLRAYWQDHRTAIVVASVSSLGANTIEQVALDTFNTWGIGSANDNRGLLVLVAPAERQVRIEVGCGLESVITDDVAKHVIEDDMIPHFRTGDYVRAVDAGVDALAERLADSAAAGPVSPTCVAIMKKAA